MDTAAQGGLIGLPALKRLEAHLQAQGLRYTWLSKPARAQGVGGRAKTVGVVRIPIGIGGYQWAD